MTAARLSDDLLKPVPNQDEPLSHKQGYRDYALSPDDPCSGEPLVDITDYGIAGQSYYSRPNNATGQPVSDVSPAVLVRRTTAERLAEINEAVKSSDMLASLFEGSVELYVDEGLRSQHVQRQLYEKVFPRLIREQFPDMSDEQVLARRDHMIAKPATDPHSPSPHATGAAIDLKLRYQQSTKLFVPDSEVFMGHANADMSNTARPDAYERGDLPDEKAKVAQRNRRIFYNTMRGGLTGKDSGFAVNPTEWWHWSYGDQMWAALTLAPTAFYGIITEPQSVYADTCYAQAHKDSF